MLSLRLVPHYKDGVATIGVTSFEHFKAILYPTVIDTTKDTLDQLEGTVYPQPATRDLPTILAPILA